MRGPFALMLTGTSIVCGASVVAADLERLQQGKIFAILGLHAAAECDEMPLGRRPFHRTDAKTQHVVARFDLLDFVLRFEPTGGLIRRQCDHFFSVDIEDREVSAGLSERIV